MCKSAIMPWARRKSRACQWLNTMQTNWHIGVLHIWHSQHWTIFPSMVSILPLQPHPSSHSHEAQTCPRGGCLWSWAVHLMELPNFGAEKHWKLLPTDFDGNFQNPPLKSMFGTQFLCRFFGWRFSEVFPSMVPLWIHWIVSIIVSLIDSLPS